MSLCSNCTNCLAVSAIAWHRSSDELPSIELLAILPQKSASRPEGPCDPFVFKMHFPINSAFKSSKMTLFVFNQKWFTRECSLRRRELKTICKGLSRAPNNPFLRGRFFTAKKVYKRTCKQAKRKQEQILMSNLESLEEKNPKEFWKALKQIKGGDKKEVDTPSSEEFFHHYKTLLQNHSETDNGEVSGVVFLTLL